VTTSNAVQGSVATAGVGRALIAQARPVLETVRWAGVGYLIFLGFQAVFRRSDHTRIPQLVGTALDHVVEQVKDLIASYWSGHHAIPGISEGIAGAPGGPGQLCVIPGVGQPLLDGSAIVVTAVAGP
jgi:hypothetical protein